MRSSLCTVTDTGGSAGEATASKRASLQRQLAAAHEWESELAAAAAAAGSTTAAAAAVAAAAGGSWGGCTAPPGGLF